jgi:MinD-like ATPase involved in chromosome partitioning or flagellar assembly
VSAQLDALRAYVAARPAMQPSRLWQNVLVVASGKGGTGTSTVAALLAAAAARRGKDTLLVDAGAAASSLVQLLGIERPPQDGTVLRLGAIGLASARSVDAGSVADRGVRYRRLTAAYASYGAVIVDAGAAMDAVLLAASAAGRLIAVTAPDRIAVTATYALLKTVGQRFGSVQLGVLGNRCDEVAGLGAWERVAAGTDRFLGHAVGFAGVIPDDAALRGEAEAGRPLDPAYRGSAAAAADHVVGRTFGEHESRRTLSLIRN